MCGFRAFMLTNKKTVVQEMRDLMRWLGYSIHTENSYCDWVARYIRFSQFNSRDELLIRPKSSVELFLTFLTADRKVAASTQNQALNALVFIH